MTEKIVAYEWHNHETGHCYVDYVPHPDQDEKDGYIKTPLYAAWQSKMPTNTEIQEAQLAYEKSEEQTKTRFDTAYCFRDFMAGVEWLRNQIEKR